MWIDINMFLPRKQKNILLKYTLVLLLLVSISFQFILPAFAEGLSPDREKEVKESIGHILSASEYQPAKEKPPSLLKALFDKLVELVKKIYEKLNFSKKISNFIFGKTLSPASALAINIIGVLILLGVLVLLVFFIVRNLRNSKRMRQDEDAMILSTIKDPEALEQKALEFCNKGDYKQALRFLYIALLIRLNEMNLIKIDKSKTNKQYLNEIMNNKPEIHSDVSEFTGDFNKYWYGDRNVDRIKFEFWYAKYRVLAQGGR